METTTSFDLNRAIQDWRENLAQSAAFRSENLNELEAHLCDSVTFLEARGLSPEEAFIIAARRVGRRAKLELEFGKINRNFVWLDRILWMLIGIQIWQLAASFGGSIVRNALSWALANFNYNYQASGLTLPVTLFSLAQLLGSATTLGLCWWLMVWKGEKWATRLLPLLLRGSTLVGTCTGLCLLSLIVNALDYGMQGLLLAKTVGPANFGATAMCLNYSMLITWPIQIVAMIIITLALVRKQLGARQGFVTGQRG